MKIIIYIYINSITLFPYERDKTFYYIIILLARRLERR